MKLSPPQDVNAQEWIRFWLVGDSLSYRYSLGAKWDCPPVAPDPARPYLTIYPRGVSLEFTTALFGGKSFGSEEPATFDGLIVNKYDNVEFVVKTDTHSYKVGAACELPVAVFE
jgi:hypothetical protein